MKTKGKSGKKIGICYVGPISRTKKTNTEYKIDEVLRFYPNIIRKLSLITAKPPSHFSKDLRDKATRFSDESLTEKVGISQVAAFPRYLWELPIQMIQIDFDVCDTFVGGFFSFYTILLAKLLRRKVVVNIIGGDVLSYAKLKYGYDYKSLLEKTLITLSIWLSDSVVVLSKFPKQKIRQISWPLSKKIWVIPVGIDTNLFKPYMGAISRFRKKNNIPTNAPIVLNVGAFLPIKGKEVLVSALSELEGDYRLAIIQQFDRKPGYSNKIDNMIKDGGITKKVIFLKSAPHNLMPSIYAACDVYVHPSHSELYPRAVVEAMSCGKPVIGSDIPAIREIITDDKDGLLFEDGNSHHLAEKIGHLFRHPGKGRLLGENARKTALRRYSISKSAKKREKMYLSLVT